MPKNRYVPICISLLILLVFTGIGYSSELEKTTGGFHLDGEYNFDKDKLGLNDSSLQTLSRQLISEDDAIDDIEQSLLLAQSEKKDPEKEEEEMSAQCRAFAKDPDADLGEVIKAGCQPTLAQMSALMDNPLGNVAMLFTQFDWTLLNNPSGSDTEANKFNYMGIAQFPKGLGKNWNIINRVVWNVPSMPIDQDKITSAARQYGSLDGPVILPPVDQGPAPIDLFRGRTTGFGDLYYNGLFAPKKGKKLENGASLLWGAGFDLGFPTATEPILGTGKWLAGPSALGVYMGPKWKVGALVQQYWDYASHDEDRDDVSLMNLQYFVFYSLSDTLSIGAAPNIIANWEQDSDNRWTVPIGIGISNTFQVGKVPLRVGGEIHYSVVQPDDVAGAEWNFRLYFIPAAPSALFKWMQ